MGDDYLPELHQYGYFTLSDYHVIAKWLNLPMGATMLDIGCGKGGPGLVLAQDWKLKLFGVDIVPEAIDQARTFQMEFDLCYYAQFEVGGFLSLPFAPDSMDAVISVDALWAVPNKIEAMAAVSRVLKPGGRFIFTFWDLLALDPVEIMAQSGLRFVGRADCPNWKEYQLKIYEGILTYEEELVEEMGEAADMLLYEARVSPPHLDASIRRIYCWEKPSI